MNKSTLRKLYLEKRHELSPEEMEIRTLSVVWNFSGLNFESIRYVHMFYPIVGKLEFNSLVLANWIRNIRPGIKLVLSKSNFENHRLSHFLWETDTPLAINQFGITEPESGVAVSPDLLDMVVVPLLAFDKKGHRVGYGKGFYDRFLSECRPDVHKIGVSCFPPVEEISDVSEFDVPLNACVTPDMIWRFDGGME